MSSSISIGHRSVAALLALLLALTLVITTPPSAAEAARGRTGDEAAAESALHAHHNSVRGGIGALQRAGDLDAVARSWADTMAGSGTLRHNPNYSAQIKNWSRVAENVGVSRGSSLTPVQLAGRIAEGYMASSGHRANILTAAFTQVGIGMTVGSDGSLWSVVVFRAPASGGTSSASGGSSSGSGGSSSASADTAGSSSATSTSAGAASTGSNGTPSARSGAGGSAAAAPADPEAQARAAEAQRQREAERARIGEAQESLARLGWYDGEVDGLLGPVTAAALAAFQAAAGLEAEGNLDEPTLAALGAEDPITAAAHEEAQARRAREAARRAAETERVLAWLVAQTAADTASQRPAHRANLTFERRAPKLPDHLTAPDRPTLVLAGTGLPADRLTRWARQPWSDAVGL